MYVQSHIIVPVHETCEVVNSHTHYPVHVPVQETCEAVNSHTHYPVHVPVQETCEAVNSHTHYPVHVPVQETCEVVNSHTHYPVYNFHTVEGWAGDFKSSGASEATRSNLRGSKHFVWEHTPTHPQE